MKIIYKSSDATFNLSIKKFGYSEFPGKILEKILGMETTIRNSTTIKKMTVKFS